MFGPFRKEKPFQGLTGFGGGATGLSQTGAGPKEGITATGGTIISYTDPDGDWKAHKFTSPGTFEITANPGDYGSTVQYMVIGGGGGGGGGSGKDRSGGGGAGTIRTDEDWPISVATYPVYIGPGGGSNTTGTNSELTHPSSPLTVTAPGGGIGNGYPGGNGGPGGSGGGGGADNGSGGTGTGDPYPGSGFMSSPTNGWGNNGGSAPPPSNFAAAGGGGAGAVGGNATGSNTAGDGGAGLQSSITGTATWYAGGGGGYGGADNNPGWGAGGSGIGGNGSPHGSPNPNGMNGDANTGSGGGGGVGAVAGGTGGSGIIVVRYQV